MASDHYDCEVSKVLHISGTNSYRIYYTGWDGIEHHFEVVATDELDAMQLGVAAIRDGRKTVRTIFVCITFILALLITSITYSCTSDSSSADTKFNTCLKLGKRAQYNAQGYMSCV